MTDRIADSRQCPYCRQWIAMPLRFARKAFEAHTAKCRAEVPGAVIVPSATIEVERQRAIRDARTPEWAADERAFMDGVRERLEAAMRPATVRRADLFGNVVDTHQTEAELNGFRMSQGALL